MRERGEGEREERGAGVELELGWNSRGTAGNCGGTMGEIVRGQWWSLGGTIGQLWGDRGKWGTLGELWGNNWGTVGKLWGNYWGTVVNDVANYGRFEPTPIPVVPDRRHDHYGRGEGEMGSGKGEGAEGCGVGG